MSKETKYLSEISKPSKNRNRKKQSAFQKLWAKAERLQKFNRQLRLDLEQLGEQVEKEIGPKQLEIGELEKSLILKIIAFQKYKSLTNHERKLARIWMHRIAASLEEKGIYDAEIEEAIARDSALEMQVELDENSDVSASEQVRKHIEEEAEKREKIFEEVFNDRVKEEIARQVKQKFGTVDSANGKDADIFQEELDSAQASRESEIEQYRKEIEPGIREELFNQGFGQFDDDDACFDDDFEFAEDYDAINDQGDSIPHPRFDSSLFKRLFRKTANALHPDKESDEDKRAEKQLLMKELLTARNQGDLLTIFKLHQQYIGEETEVNAKDEKELTQVLKHHIDALEDEKHEIAYGSGRSGMLYEVFHARTKKVRDRKIQEYVSDLNEEIEIISHTIEAVYNLRTLKEVLREVIEPQLFDEYDMFHDSLFDFDEPNDRPFY